MSVLSTGWRSFSSNQSTSTTTRRPTSSPRPCQLVNPLKGRPPHLDCHFGHDPVANSPCAVPQAQVSPACLPVSALLPGLASTFAARHRITFETKRASLQRQPATACLPYLIYTYLPSVPTNLPTCQLPTAHCPLPTYYLLGDVAVVLATCSLPPDLYEYLKAPAPTPEPFHDVSVTTLHCRSLAHLPLPLPTFLPSLSPAPLPSTITHHLYTYLLSGHLDIFVTSPWPASRPRPHWTWEGFSLTSHQDHCHHLTNAHNDLL